MGAIADVRSGAKTQLDAVRTASPSVLLQVYGARPANMGSLPCAWVDEARYNLLHTSGTRQWEGEVDIIVVAASFDNAEAVQELDAVTTLILDQFTDTPHAFGGNSVAEPVRVRAGSVDIGGVVHPATILTIGRFTYMEPRT